MSRASMRRPHICPMIHSCRTSMATSALRPLSSAGGLASLLPSTSQKRTLDMLAFSFRLAQEVERAAAADIEQFAAEQAAAETAEITPLLAETGGLAAAATGAAEALGGAVALAPKFAIPAALGLVAGAGGGLLAGRSEAGTQTEPPRGSGVAAAAGGALEGVRAGASAFPAARNIGRAGGAAVGGLGDWAWAQWAEPTRAPGTCSEAAAEASRAPQRVPRLANTERHAARCAAGSVSARGSPGCSSPWSRA